MNLLFYFGTVATGLTIDLEDKMKELIRLLKSNEKKQPSTNEELDRKKAVFDLVKSMKIQDQISKEFLLEYLNAANNYGNWVSYTFKEAKCRYFEKFILLEIPLSRLDKNEEIHHPENLEPFKQLYLHSNWFPPIIFDHHRNYIIDGRHRVEVSRRLGLQSILGFVGVPYLSLEYLSKKRS